MFDLPYSFGELNGEDRHASCSLRQDDIAWCERLEAVQCVPGCESSARKSGAFLVRERWRHENETVLVEDAVGAEGAIEGTAEAGLRGLEVEGAAEVGLVE